MKKPFKILICLFAFLSLLPLCGCKSAKVEGTYATTSLSAMGLSATQKSFSSYSENRTETDKNHNTLYKPMQLLFDTQLVLNENKTASLTIFGFESTLNGDSHYSSVVDEAKSKGYVKNGNLVIKEHLKEFMNIRNMLIDLVRIFCQGTKTDTLIAGKDEELKQHQRNEQKHRQNDACKPLEVEPLKYQITGRKAEIGDRNQENPDR